MEIKSDFESDKIIGIVGGMGPQSGLALFSSILSKTNASIDQEHPSVIMMSLPRHIVDRSSFLAGETEVNPGFILSKIILNLNTSGAKVVGMACNTAYSPQIYGVILEELKKAGSDVQLINMPLETCLYLKSSGIKVCNIGLMTTNGTYKSEIYKRNLEEFGYNVIIPDPEFQDSVIHKMIYDAKFGVKAKFNPIDKRAALLMRQALDYFKERDADTIILGCTELPLIFKKRLYENITVIDPTEILAEALLRESAY